MQFLLALLHFSRCVMRMESILLFHIVQMPVADVPDRNRCRWHRDNAKQEVPGKKEFRQNKCIRHTPAHKMRQLINMNITKRLLFASRLVWIAAWEKLPGIL